MKYKVYIFVMIVPVLLVSCSIFRKGVQDNRTLKEKVESKNFTISISHCNPSNFRDSYLGNDVELKLKNDSAFSNLPFFGVVNVAPIDQNDGGLNFEKPMLDYVLKNTTQMGWILMFKIQTPQYRYQFRTDISNAGKVIITVISNERSPMTYYGEVQ